MTHETLFRFYMRRKKEYDPSRRPDYSALRTFVDLPVPDGFELVETDFDGIPGEWIRRKGPKSDKVILFIHGGGFTSCDKGTDRSACFYIASHSDYSVYNTNYRLAPEHPFPAGPDDCYKVYSHLVSEVGASNICVMGESAGSNLALGLCLRAKDNGLELPSCLVLFSPPVQSAHPYPSHSANQPTDCIVSNFQEEGRAEYFQTEDLSVLESPLASPIYGDFTGFPPAKIFCSDSEALFDDAVELQRKMRAQGCECRMEIAHSLIHVYPIFVALEEGSKAMDRAVAFVKQFL